MINFSIITPTYNNPKELEKYLLSLEKFNFKSNEIIIIDDSFETPVDQTIKKFSQLPIKFIKLKKKEFISQKRNLGAKESKNELIFFIDSDVILEKNSLLILIDSLKNYPDIAMIGGTIMQEGVKLHPTKNDRLLSHGEVHLCEVIYSPYLALYKSVFFQVNGYDEIFENRGEGTDLSIKFWRAGFPIGRNLNSIVNHPSFKSERSSSNRIAEMYRSLFLVAYKYGISFEENPHFVEMYQERKEAYGEKCEFYVIYSAAKYLNWFAENIDKIKKSKNSIPNEYDFKPFDIFTKKDLLKSCLGEARSRIEPFYKKVF